MVGLHQIVAGNVITYSTKLSKVLGLWLHLKEIFSLGIGLRLTLKKYRNKT